MELNADQTLIAKILAAREEIDEACELTLQAPIQTSGLKKPTGAFRTFSLEGNETFSFVGMRQGKRSSYIFEFEPIDDRAYSKIEFVEEAVFTAFPELESKLIEALELPDAKNWKQAAAKFRSNFKKAERKAAINAEREEAKSIEAHYANDPEYGSW